MQSSGKDEFTVTLVNPAVAAAPHEMVLLTTLFDGQPPGAVRGPLRAGQSVTSAHQAMRQAVRDQVAARGWFRKVPSGQGDQERGLRQQSP